MSIGAKGSATGTTGSATGGGGNGHRRRSGRTDRRGGHKISGEGILGIVHKVLDELEVLGLELLTGSLQTVDHLPHAYLCGHDVRDVVDDAE